MRLNEISACVREVAEHYPKERRASQLRDVPRISFHIALATKDLEPAKSTICDIGGGLGLFTQSCGAVGFNRVIMVDDMGDEAHRKAGDTIRPVFEKYRVEVISRDVVSQGLGESFAEGQVDVFTCFESMEHWHHSPKALFSRVFACLKPGGRFVLGVPNCVNLRKRLTVPFGVGRWSSMEDWYEVPIFRGHVREPDVDDLHYIARDMGLQDVSVMGRNWLGYVSRFGFVRALTPFLDRPLQLFPGLCSDIYLVGTKRA